MNTVRRAKSPNLNLTDFYLRGPLKNAVYDIAVNDVLEQRAEDGSKIMCYACGTSELVGHSLM